MRAIAEVVQVMIEGVREGRVINLNAVKNEAARRHGLKRTPKLVELISAVPDEHRDALLPQLRAKPAGACLHSLTSQLNLSAFHGIGVARRGCARGGSPS